jgi:hypothetical protein
MLQLHNPLDKLHQHYPNDANELEKISHALDSAGVTHYDHLALSNNNTPQSLEDTAQAHHRLAEEYDHVLVRIRNLPGFGEFLQPEKSASLCSAQRMHSRKLFEDTTADDKNHQLQIHATIIQQTRST